MSYEERLSGDELLAALDNDIFSEEDYDFEWEEDDSLENPSECDACN